MKLKVSLQKEPEVLADIAVRLEREVKWDPVEGHFVGDEKATKVLSRPMRAAARP